jgi:hypothetical protein
LPDPLLDEDEPEEEEEAAVVAAAAAALEEDSQAAAAAAEEEEAQAASAKDLEAARKVKGQLGGRAEREKKEVTYQQRRQPKRRKPSKRLCNAESSTCQSHSVDRGKRNEEGLQQRTVGGGGGRSPELVSVSGSGRGRRGGCSEGGMEGEMMGVKSVFAILDKERTEGKVAHRPTQHPHSPYSRPKPRRSRKRW